MHMKTIFSFVLLSTLACTGLQAQQAQTVAGPAGIWVLAGTDLPEGNHFTIERRQEGGNWTEAGKLLRPGSADEMRARILDINGLDIGFDRMPGTREITFLWKEFSAGRRDSLQGWAADLPVQYALGRAWYDANAEKGKRYVYRIQQTKGRETIAGSRAETRATAWPGNPANTLFRPVSAKPGIGGMSVTYRIPVRGNLARVQVFRAYFQRTGFQRIEPQLIFYTENDTLMLRFLDQTAAEKVPYAYTVQAVDMAGNAGSLAPVVSAYQMPAGSIQPSVDRIKTRSLTAQNAIRVSWKLKNADGIVSIDLYKSLIHDGRFFRIASLAPDDTAYIDNDVTPVRTYYYTIVLNGAYESSPPSPRVSGMLEAGSSNNNLLPVQNLEAAQQRRVIRLGWQRTETDTRGYYIYRAAGRDGEFQQLGDILLSDTTHLVFSDTVPETEDAVLYRYQIRDVNTAYHIGPPSETMAILAAGRTAFPAITDLRAEVLAPGKIHLLWPDMTENSAWVSRYILMRRSDCDGGSRKVLALLNTDSTVFTDSSLKEGCTYYYAVYSTGNDTAVRSTSAGEAAYSFTEESLPGLSDIRMFAADDGVRISWVTPLDPRLAGIRILRASGGAEATQLTQVSPSTESYHDKTAGAALTHFYFFKTVDAQGREGALQGPIGVYRE
jgi:fibronectin type 3 domain-containing protein